MKLVNILPDAAKWDCSMKNALTTTGGRCTWFNFHRLCFWSSLLYNTLYTINQTHVEPSTATSYIRMSYTFPSKWNEHSKHRTGTQKVTSAVTWVCTGNSSKCTNNVATLTEDSDGFLQYILANCMTVSNQYLILVTKCKYCWTWL